MNAALEQTIEQIRRMSRWHADHSAELQALGAEARAKVLAGEPRLWVNKWYEDKAQAIPGHGSWLNTDA